MTLERLLCVRAVNENSDSLESWEKAKESLLGLRLRYFRQSLIQEVEIKRKGGSNTPLGSIPT